ncbi:hypothetical protein GWI33_010399 [Rhynchophorus ferrugineus]|uniref:Uncharacterized protein n=1 Tax=Rhynchophorus ferrugineus TaxID=354439 RepID=A0A834IXD4_RHYFE|nr:hypothetical protein GWI33_010399 [Rhynchophorus ferrugineus]
MAEHRTGEYLNVCRLCLCDRPESLKSIFDVELGPNRLQQKIHQLVAIQVSRQDQFSTLVCNDCIIRLDTFHSYKRECHRNQTKLIELMNKTGVLSPDEPILRIKPDPDSEEISEAGLMNGTHPVWPIKVEIDEPMDDEYNELPPEIVAKYGSDDGQTYDCPERQPEAPSLRAHQSSTHKKDKRTPMCEIRKTGDELEGIERHGVGKDANENDDRTVRTMMNHVGVDPANNEDTMSNQASDQRTQGASENPETDHQKIQFAAGLKLVQKDTTPIECEALSKIELSYIEKCKAMVSMFQTLQCACHNAHHKSKHNLMSHLREQRIWFPLFTCYDCMTSFTDRSSYLKHNPKCPKTQLETLMKLSNLKKRNEIKTRVYQNFKCNRCQFLFSFYDDYCRHVEEEHAHGEPPIYCSCGLVFDALKEYKHHCFRSCLLSYYCDICFVATATLEEFVKHCQEHHDRSEGFVLLQEAVYSPRKMPAPKECDEEGASEAKQERRRSLRPLASVDMYDGTKDESVAKKKADLGALLKNLPAKIIVSKILGMGDVITAADWRKAASCPTCDRDYSSMHNMVRHYKTHLERNEVDVPPEVLSQIKSHQPEEDESAVYSCPDCGGMFNSAEWTQHLDENHPSLNCDECDDVFRFQSELKQHKIEQHNQNGFKDIASVLTPAVEIDDVGEVMVTCDLCDTMFKTKDDLRSHKMLYHQPSNRSDSSVNGDGFDEDDDMPVLDNEEDEGKPGFVEKFMCEHCDRVYASLKTLKEHLKNKHGTSYAQKGTEFPKKCDYCDKMCMTPASLYLHTQMHERMTLSDLRDDKSAIGKARKRSELENAADPEEEESYYNCKYCFKVFSNRGKLKDHMKCHTPTNLVKRARKFLCDLCHTAFDSRPDLEAHKVEDHAEEMDEMPQLVSQMEVEVEIKQEVEDEKFEVPKMKNMFCKYCRRAFSSLVELTRHMRDEHGDSPKIRMPRDKRKDNVEKNIKCPLCKKAFASVGAMTAHAGWHKRAGSRLENPEAHSPQAIAALKLARQSRVFNKKSAPPKPQPASRFQCSTCFARLPNDTALQIHILEQHRNLEEVMLVPRCNTCNKDFKSQLEYDTHKRYHELVERQKRMSGGQPLPKKNPCNYCSSSFTRTDTLAAHVRQHHPEHVRTEFRCDQCDRVFEKQNSLTIHLKVHEKQRNGGGPAPPPPGGKVYLCPICNMTFNFTKDLRMHTIKAHPF